MARFGDNPVQDPLVGNEQIPAENPANNEDVTLTPLILVQFVQQNLSLAAGSSNGFVTPAERTKLDALYTKAQTDTLLAELGQVAFPVFFGTPGDGSVAIYQHCLTIDWVIQALNACVSAGSTNITITRNGTPIVGLQNVPVTTTPVGASAADPTNQTFENNDVLGIDFSGTTGNCADLRIANLFYATLTP